MTAEAGVTYANHYSIATTVKGIFNITARDSVTKSCDLSWARDLLDGKIILFSAGTKQ